MVLAGLWAQPSDAFALAGFQPRAVQADVVANASAYIRMAQPTCNGFTLVPNTGCTFTVTNAGTTPLTFTVVKVSDPNSIVSAYSNGTAPTNVGSASTVSVTVRACGVCAGQLMKALFDVTATSAGVEDAKIYHYEFTAQY